jgi:DNA-binding LacI/PurR family transcriptional regulator
MSFDVPRRRERGFVDELARRGVPLDPSLAVGANFGIDDGREAMEQLLDLDDTPTAVFAMSDDMAFGALTAIRDRGLVAGDDVSLMGVDDHEFARVVELTTIHQPVADHGSVGARLVVDELSRMAATEPAGPDPAGPDPTSGPPGPSRVIEAKIELVVRRTTGPPPSHRSDAAEVEHAGTARRPPTRAGIT